LKIFFILLYIFKIEKDLKRRRRKKKNVHHYLEGEERERERESTLQPSFSFVSQNNMTHHACSYFISPNSQKS
jgi:hypothetical protein